MKICIRNKNSIELDSIRIEKDGREFLIKDVVGGIEVTDIGIESIAIQPRVANSILVIINK